MRRASVAAAGFALAAGLAADPERYVLVSHSPDRFGRLLLACVEPLEPSARGNELANVALKAISEAFHSSPGSPTEALLAAFDAANGAVVAENRPLSTGRWDRRICVGATAIALTSQEIIVAQSAPSQAILVQDGQVYAFPDVASWRGGGVHRAGRQPAGASGVAGAGAAPEAARPSHAPPPVQSPGVSHRAVRRCQR